MLAGPAVRAWKARGSSWKAWSLKFVTATLVTGWGSSGRLHVMPCYGPKFAAGREEKDEFFDSLQQALSMIPSEKNYVMLGDFNARVGSRVDGEWRHVRGPHGYGELNEATVCNTWLQKIAIHQ